MRLHDLLIVEDDSRTRRLYELTLAHWGLPLQVTLAKDGFEALLKIGERAPDTLVTDLNMPGMDGFRLIAALRLDPRFQATQIIVISGSSAAEIKANGGLPKGVTLLAKPIPFGDLRKLIEHRLIN
jgi:CheY-like chemotaxis protein